MRSSSTTNSNVTESPTLSSVETIASVTVNREDAISAPHPTASTWFDLVKRAGRVSAECWNYFHVVNKVLDESKLDDKLISKPHLACCNVCGKAFSYSSPPKINPGGKPKMTNATLESHLMSHNVSFGKLCVLFFGLNCLFLFIKSVFFTHSRC